MVRLKMDVKFSARFTRRYGNGLSRVGPSTGEGRLMAEETGWLFRAEPTSTLMKNLIVSFMRSEESTVLARLVPLPYSRRLDAPDSRGGLQGVTLALGIAIPVRRRTPTAHVREIRVCVGRLHARAPRFVSCIMPYVGAILYMLEYTVATSRGGGNAGT